MPRKFKKGDEVRVRLDSASPFKGQVGIVDKVILDADEASYFYYIRLKNVNTPIRLDEDQLEAAT